MAILHQNTLGIRWVRFAMLARWTIRFCLAAMLCFIFFALHKWGAAEVRTSVEDILFLTGLGAIWLVISKGLFAWMGVGSRDDAVERRNPAALVAICGGIISVALIYAGGQLGEGPSYWNNIFSAGLGTAGLFLLWMLLELGSHVSVSITEERNFASGLRLCGFVLAVGLIFGRAVAGDWQSESATLHDFFRDGWPAIGILFLALVIEWLTRPNAMRPFPSWPRYGLMPAVLYVGLALAWLLHLGRWEGMPR